MYVLGVDPGLAHLGLALYEPITRKVVQGYVVETKKDPRKGKLVREDTAERFASLYRELSKFANPYTSEIIAVCTEGMSQPRAAGAAAKLFVSWGGILGWAAERAIPVYQVSPQNLKKYIVGVSTASKDQMIGAIQSGHPELVWPRRKGLQEHLADAVGAAKTLCDTQPDIQMVLRVWRHNHS